MSTATRQHQQDVSLGLYLDLGLDPHAAEHSDVDRDDANLQHHLTGDRGGSTASSTGSHTQTEQMADVVQQMQQMEVSASDNSDSVEANGVDFRNTPDAAANNAYSSAASTTTDATWDFLTNTAQMFERTPELTEIIAADIRRGYDMQGYRWSGYELQKQMYMSYRRDVYPQYQSVPHNVQKVRRGANCVDSTASYYDFRYSTTGNDYKCEINHFQLRNLVWATSSYDVFYWHSDGVQCWNPWLRTNKCVLEWGHMPKAFKLSAMSVDDGFVFVGDYRGRYCLKPLRDGSDPVAGSLSQIPDDEDIVNHLTPMRSSGGAYQVLVAQNKGHIRCFNVERLKVVSDIEFKWAVNSTAVTASGSLACVVGDSCEGLLTDPRQNYRTIAQLCGHMDYSFTCAFSPDERLVATGNQDTSTRVYDIRWPQQALATLCGYIGAVRSVKFSPCGRYLLTAEPADYLHVYETSTFGNAQDIEFMGEVAGAVFSPDANCLFVGISDSIHECGLVEFTSSTTAGADTIGDMWL
ncbi:WD40 repeat-like protein [Coemansia reversa NRRL 1564]|uniref:WD40 repeat-like protein n=1 Tax=Coemansia reversa (strain ATCC 12441 / NRRL 1564) TaxID=763665 RepID=A0A2G5BDG8_COERN|nr:WD40 repeat-like protein [Coemansia reversa NRRL 1564]|eukprot:PIA17058.1 WD40 repeat-like protein [Coemansia reversa NRRL 1564]